MAEMTFWDHLEELRQSLLRMLIALVVLSIVCFIFMPRMFDPVVMGPCFGTFPLYRWLAALSMDPFSGASGVGDTSFQIHLINIKLTSQFMVHLWTSLWCAVLMGFPYLLFELWRFVAPALYEKERGGLRMAFMLGSVLFYVGLSVGYFIVFPITLRFLAGYHITSLVSNQLSLDSYISSFFSMILIMGIVFELPMLALILSKLGLVRRSFFRKYRRHAIVLLVILAAVITPTGDPFTLTIVSVPLLLLYEFSALLVKK
jgi:sec-independent protein translocase protein TatC